MMPQGAPRVCGDDPKEFQLQDTGDDVLPAYAGMIPIRGVLTMSLMLCSPRMRG